MLNVLIYSEAKKCYCRSSTWKYCIMLGISYVIAENGDADSVYK